MACQMAEPHQNHLATKQRVSANPLRFAKMVMHAGRDAAYTPIDALGNSINGGELEVNVEDMGEQMVVEICDQAHQVVAMSTIGLAAMWEVRTSRYLFGIQSEGKRGEQLPWVMHQCK